MAKRKRSVEKESMEDPRDEFLSLFVKDSDDEVRGETIGVEGKEIVMKNGSHFLKVPMDSLRLEENILRVVKRIDWKKARKKGERWKKRELDPLQV
jgi:hypothetical protein